jgi:glycerol-3-phosphate acyltransferase PlsY
VNYLVVVIAYVLGTLPSAQVVAGRSGVDPTSAGSGNPGATNVYRTAGRRAGLVVFAFDVGKGVVAVLLGMAIAGRPLALACWVAATVGHVLPVTRRLRGGKGVATGGGGSIVLFPVLAVGVIALFALVARVTGKASMGSIAIALALPVAVAAAGNTTREVLVAAAISALVLVRHVANIRRLLTGEEGSWRR